MVMLMVVVVVILILMVVAMVVLVVEMMMLLVLVVMVLVMIVVVVKVVKVMVLVMKVFVMINAGDQSPPGRFRGITFDYSKGFLKSSYPLAVDIAHNMLNRLYVRPPPLP
ncbi:hypothetical protein DPMN_053817 [Dreissena polymorpha]|uniref:Uncharacterized protein n=1 Tax=Dreissena polymorpha TaxID=45954 RepID=A0A9D4HP66_DREPO|nr:hypothetical protein DPMN_053817 [Dreissena polymorpha]